MVVDAVELVLSSTLWIGHMGTTVVLDKCSNERCGRPVRELIPVGDESVEARCCKRLTRYNITLEQSPASWDPTT